MNIPDNVLYFSGSEKSGETTGLVHLRMTGILGTLEGFKAGFTTTGLGAGGTTTGGFV